MSIGEIGGVMFLVVVAMAVALGLREAYLNYTAEDTSRSRPEENDERMATD